MGLLGNSMGGRQELLAPHPGAAGGIRSCFPTFAWDGEIIPAELGFSYHLHWKTDGGLGKSYGIGKFGKERGKTKGARKFLGKVKQGFDSLLGLWEEANPTLLGAFPGFQVFLEWDGLCSVLVVYVGINPCSWPQDIWSS